MSLPEKNSSADLAESGPATRTRMVVLWFLCALAFVLYLDRVCIAKAAPSIVKDLGISKTQMGAVFAAFTVAYGLFEVPTGHWADRIGSRVVLTRISIWWSIFTALTGACGNFWSLIAVRFLFGAGEAGAYPNAARIFSRWFPVHERGRVQGILQFAALIGGATAPVAAAYMIDAVGWRWTFVIFGATGVVWALAFVVWFRDSPAEHPQVNAAELALIGVPIAAQEQHRAIPWKSVFATPSIFLLALIMACAACNSYIYFSWFPTYLENARLVSSERTGWLSTLVLIGAAIGNLSGGWLTDRIMRSSTRPMRMRRMMGTTAYVLGAALLLIGVRAESANVTAFLLALSCLVLQSTLSNWWSCAIEVSGRHIGALFGLMNGIGGFGAMASQFFFGWFADWRESLGYEGRAQWDPAFDIVVGVLLTAAVSWQFVDTSRPIESDPQPKNAL